jgi:predicted membrane channel-forming protein YqfA (hemolysin III family)
LTIVTNVHPKLQSQKYRSMRTLAFVATGMSVVLPLIHGLNIFGLDLMNKKAFTYTMVAKIGFLLSGTALYVVSLIFCPHKRNIDFNTHNSKDEVSRKLVAWKI